MKILLSWVLLVFSLCSFAKEISLSFDDAPRADTAYLKGTERTKRLLAALMPQRLRRLLSMPMEIRFLVKMSFKDLKTIKRQVIL